MQDRCVIMITKFRLGICLDFVSHPDLPRGGCTFYFVPLFGIDDLILAGFFFLITLINVTYFLITCSRLPERLTYLQSWHFFTVVNTVVEFLELCL